MSAKNLGKESNRDIRFLHRAVFVLLLVIVLLATALWRMPKQITVYTPPDISKSFVQHTNEVPLETVYGFARTLWEALNYCESDCADEYPETLKRYGNYLTTSCYTELYEHFTNNTDQYRYRNRLLIPTDKSIFDMSRIRKMSDDVWFVRLPYVLRDQVKGIQTRNNEMEYPLKVVRSFRPLNENPIGLEIDCFFGGGPKLIEQHEITIPEDNSVGESNAQ